MNPKVMANVLTEILRSANKHPNSRVSKLVHLVEDEPTQKNIVLLLIELAEHAEYSIDFNVSLRYYLDLFERLGITHDLCLNEAGLLLVNSSKIYAKRVDYVQSLVERQILTLSNADDELQKQKLEEQQQAENAVPVEKPKRGRKRALDAPTNPYEIELIPKKFKKLTEEKRFALPKTLINSKSIYRNIEMEQHIHPVGWQYATIHDLENEEDVDTKRNYKLFTYHVEHRYNTLVPDINFRLHFKVKDYIDEQEEMEEENDPNKTDRCWPPLSEAYVEKYLRLENYILGQDMQSKNRKQEKQRDATILNRDHANVTTTQQILDTSNDAESVETSIVNTSSSSKNDSGLGQSTFDDSNNTLENTQLNCTFETSTVETNLNFNTTDANKSFKASELQIENDSALGTSVLDGSGSTQNNTPEKFADLSTTTNDGNGNESTQTDISNTLNDSDFSNTNKVENSISDKITQNLEATEGSTKAVSTIIDTIVRDVEELKHAVEELIQAPKNGKDTVLSNDHHDSAETIFHDDDEIGKKLKIDVAQQQDKDTSQIRIHFPHTDDEGVYFSDIEENECQLLTPVIKTANILPGVERKDITIFMDEELCQALEMRDGIMKHFSHETFTVPIITEPRKQNLIFNILKLPEKMLRRKVLFKLGPEMNLYLQARSLKRCRPEPITIPCHNSKFLQWFPLNNIDMTGVFMTPPYSPGHCSDFCGFADGDNDTMSCADFFGFTEEEQTSLMTKSVNRLSRDSGVGVEGYNLTLDKEAMEFFFDDREKCKKNLNPDKTQESVESILKQLPADIREVLTAEIRDNIEKNSTKTDKNGESVADSNKLNEDTQKLNAQCNIEQSEQILTENGFAMQVSSESSELLKSAKYTKESEDNTQNILNNNTQESDLLTEHSSKSQSCADQSILNRESLLDREIDTQSSKNPETLQNGDVEIPCGKECQEKVNFDVEQNSEVHDANDDVILDLNMQSTKTKIQQWHEHLQPILAKSRERHHFDVYKLGSEIIDTVQSERKSIDKPLNEVESTDALSNQNVATFQDVMADKDKSYVSRYFLSTLLLANQSNIEISIGNKSPEKPSSWHDINLKLLTTKRHTVAIEDNIGMIDSKQKASEHNGKQNVKEIKNRTTEKHQRGPEEEDEPLIKLKCIEKSSTKLKTILKRTSMDSDTTSCIADKKPREIVFPTIPLNNGCKELSNIQLIMRPFAKTPATVNTIEPPIANNLPEIINTAMLNVNINDIRTLQPIEKVQKRCDDHDSGVFSIDEMSTS